MSEYNIQMNKYNALNTEYDQLYPKPMKHAITHAKDGSDPITPADIGAYSKTETDSLLSSKPNPNLLDNWYFGNPVNQRGQTEYTGGGYTVDRWIANAHQITISNGIALSADDFYFQKIEQSTMDALSGKQITFSVLTTGNVFLTGSWVVDNTVQSDTKIAENNEFALYRSPWTGSGWGIATKTATHILAAKLELGSQQTLAHQGENGNWVLNEIPNYGEQLMRCQRYHFEFGPSHALIAYDAYGVNSPVVYFPAQMRTVPSIKVYSKAGNENAISYWNGSAEVDFTDFYLESNENFVVLRSNGKLTPGGIYTVGKLIASAEL